MKTLIYFNTTNCPEQIGCSQLTEDLTTFLAERSEIIINPVITENKLTFEKQDGTFADAVLLEVDADFQN
jgi:hypothetical protein